MPDFIPGLDLAQMFYENVVRPIVDEEYPRLPHSAGFLGPGSEVLGFDDEMSTDHNWGLQFVLYLKDRDLPRLAQPLHTLLAHRLPYQFRGFFTHFEAVPDDPGTEIPVERSDGPINHHVYITSLRRVVREHMHMDVDKELSVMDWLLIPEQVLLSFTRGRVFHDGLDQLIPLRRKLAYYPDDIWLYLLSAQWQRLGQEEPFVGRAGIVGDNLGSAVIAARLVRDVMRLVFLMERQYAPYPKWFGSAFARLDCAAQLIPVLEAALQATSWQQRERHLGSAYEIAAAMHNARGITAPIPDQVSPFHSRPFQVIQGESIARAIWGRISDPEVKALPFGIGKVDQFSDSTDVRSDIQMARRLAAIYSIT
jgi:hypothetical protein